MIIGRKPSQIAKLVFSISVLAGLAVLIMIFGAGLSLWEPIDGFIYYRRSYLYIGYAVVALSAVCLFYLFRKKNLVGKKRAILSLLIGLAILWPQVSKLVTESVSYPPIHDITTDTVNPPQFVFLTDDRPGARNTLNYFGKERQEWYPSRQLEFEPFSDIKPIMTTLSPDEAYAKAVSVGEAMGWEIVGADPAGHRFEGIATTPFFRFVDDTVVVVSEAPNGSRIDVRSVSRIGVGDIGVNAKRIQEFTRLFNE